MTPELAAEIDMHVRAAHEEVVRLQELLEEARDRRAMVFAMAQERGYSCGGISRVLGPGMRPERVHWDVKIGRRILADRRAALAALAEGAEQEMSGVA